MDRFGTVFAPTLQLGHGDEAVETLWWSSSPCPPGASFNWATAMKPWRRFTLEFTKPAQPELQLGHGDEAVETSGSNPHSLYIAWLQLGHGDEAVETWASREERAIGWKLQLGHGDEAVETGTAQ